MAGMVQNETSMFCRPPFFKSRWRSAIRAILDKPFRENDEDGY
jgi:hypothetical protein